jgi:hypothetical protein
MTYPCLCTLHAVGFLIGAIVCWSLGWHVPGFLFTLATIAFTSDWIRTARQTPDIRR